ncbi:mannosyltransferase [Coemansia sp. RSA 1722]|nr:mannosyltransferase [Coemansia sp. RSA 486]KAJ2236999.1 mannosyltransferase [Coemansia sp. RSA 485]KAJ2602883.1 mannosyltransferase [Coemansia sp. RSA 1722]
MLRQRQSLKAERQQRRQTKQTKRAAKATALATQEINAVSQLSPTLSTPFVPSVSVLFRLFSVVRIIGALSAPIQDCDEVYNYWEQLHFLQFGWGKQTWEYAPQFALRSYGFLYIYKALAWVLHLGVGFRSKVQVFYALRVAMGVVSAACEAVVVRRVAEVDGRVAVWMAVGMVGMAGLWHQAVALLPSSFAMYWCMLGMAATMQVPGRGRIRTLGFCAFAVAAACGWPYAAVAAVPAAIEELLWALRSRQFRHLAVVMAVGAGTVFSCVALMAAVDSYYYGKPVVAAWNQVAYNVFGGTAGGDSTLYGTEPWHFYLRNGLLNGSLLMVLALASAPLWLIYQMVLMRAAQKASSDAARDAARKLRDRHVLLLFRLAPFHLALLVFSLQPHKEERFLSIVYPHMCFNAAAALSLLQPLGVWLRDLLPVSRGSRNGDVGRWTRIVGWSVVCVAAVLGFLRMAALSQYYGAPIRAFIALQASVSNNSNNQSGSLPLLPLGPSIKTLVGAKPIDYLPGAPEIRTVCMGREWHHFPSSYWLPQNFRLQFVSWDGAAGLLPGDFVPVSSSGSVRASTMAERRDFNALNRWEPTHAENSTVTCDYFVGVKDGSGMVDDVVWETVACVPMLDAPNSRLVARALYVPMRVARLLDFAVTGKNSSGGAGWLRWNSMCVMSRRKAY